MDEKKVKVRRNNVIHCENCGEDYAATYKRCPFCDEANSSAGGRRTYNGRGGGYGGGLTPMRVITVVVPLILIIAAIYIVITVVGPLISRGNHADPDDTPSSPVTSQTPAPSETDSPSTSPEPTDTETPSPTPSVSPSPSVDVSDVTAITLNREDFTMSAAGETWNLSPQVTPAGATGTITWTTSNDKVATVDSTGKVTAVGGGNCTITASSGSVKAECIVRVKGSAASEGGSTTTTTTTTTTAGGLTLSHTSFTISSRYPDPVTITATGASGTVTWSSSNANVATVDANGKVTAVGNGSCTITASSDGQSATCMVYVNK